MQQLALGWLAYRLSNSPFVLGAITFASQAPTFFLSPITGAVVDRVNRHKLVICTQSLCMLQAFILSGLTLAHVVQVWHLFALGIFIAIVNAVDMPGRQAFMVQMVEHKEDLPNAIALNSSLVNAARLVGPTVAGFVISWVGEGWCFFLNGVSYLAVILALIMMKVTPLPPVERKATDPYSHLKEGWSYVFGFAPIRALILLLAITSLFGAPYSVLMPVFAKKVFSGNAQLLGLLMGSAGVGALTGAIALASRRTVPGLGRWIMLSTLLFGFALIGFGMCHHAATGMLLLVFIGFGFMVQLAATNTVLQTITDDDKRGRVMSFYTMAFMVAPFGGLLGGALADRIGAAHTVLIGGVFTAFAGFIFALQLPRLRAAARTVYIEKGLIPTEPLPPA